MRQRRHIAALVALVALVAPACGVAQAGGSTFRIGLLYPTTGAQGVQGLEERRGAMLAAEWVDAHGGAGGHRVELLAQDLDRPEGVPAAMAALQSRGVSVVVGTHGSTFSAVAAAEATRRHLLLWETGAVGDPWVWGPGGDGAYDISADEAFIRMAPMGSNLGKAAVDFVHEGLSSQLPGGARPLRWAVAYVDDAYGRTVAAGAAGEARATGQPVVGVFPYAAAGTDFTALVARIAASHPEALYVAAYLADGEALRRALVAAHVPLVVNLGTSSSYCMPAFGAQLGAQAVGVFASDKPDAAAVRTDALSPGARATLAWASTTYQRRYHEAMTSHALSGFSNAFALFRYVLPGAGSATAPAVAAAAQRTKLPLGTLANGAGMDIAPPGAPDAGNNRAAANVIWEWVAPGREEVVWPPAFATHAPVYLPIDW